MNRERNSAPRAEGEERVRRGKRMRASAGSDRKPPREHTRRWLFLAMDVLLLAGIVAVVIYLVSLLTPFSVFGSDRQEPRNILYTVEIAGVEQGVFESLNEGDAVIDSVTGATIGVVESVVQRTYSVYTDVPTAEKDELLDSYVVTKATYPDALNTVTVVIAVEAEYEAEVGYTVDDCRIAIGRSYALRFPACAGEGVCIALQTK